MSNDVFVTFTWQTTAYIDNDAMPYTNNDKSKTNGKKSGP